MDCEMVGVGQGNKSALGRVTLLILSSFSFTLCSARSLSLALLANSFVNGWGNVVYDEFVRPVERVVDFLEEHICENHSFSDGTSRLEVL
ncbi:hypothetical protein DVH24_003729 [Malus domestica]|uniref:Uncharacterized protein n=1 Tax=Malus domestica TaxID=3750 RepID=A0A498IP28_MALDO|nr:hypothetical protein DVH24_003729 [Malus domestica]